MDILASEQLSGLMEYRSEICVSLYMPAYPVGPERRQNQIRFRNLVRRAEDELKTRGFRSPDAEGFLSPLKPLAADDPFWSFIQSEGFCAFLSGRDLFYYRLPLRFHERVVVLNRFYVKPLLGLVCNDSRFFLLALGLNGVRLFQCSRYSMNELVLEKVPGSLEEAMRYSDPQRQLQFHTHTPQSGAKRAAMFHGQGVGTDDRKSNILEYFKIVDRGVRTVIGHERVPLLFAGLEHLFGIYRKANSYPHLSEESVAVNPEDLTDGQLHERAVRTMDTYFLAARDEAIKAYLDLAGTGRTAGDIEIILPEAFGGRVEKLLISAERPQWGTFDPLTLKAAVHEKPLGDDEDLMDLACVYTYLKGGAVYDVVPGTVPGLPSPAAVFRY